MKQFFLLFLAVASAFSVQAQQCDTIVVEQPNRVFINKSETETQIIVEGSKQNDNYRYEERIGINDNTVVETASSNKPYTSLGLDFTILEDRINRGILEAVIGTGLYAGMFVPTGGVMPTHFLNSVDMEIDIAGFRYLPGKHKWWLDLTFGIGMTNYDFKGDNGLIADQDGKPMLLPYPEQSHDHKSELFLTNVNLKFMYYRSIGKDSALGLGLFWQGNYPRYCHSSFVLGDEKNEVTRKLSENFYNNNCFGSRLEYRWGGGRCSLYAKYMFSDLFKKDGDIKLPPLSIGIGYRF